MGGSIRGFVCRRVDAIAANRLLDAAGWVVGPDGMRHKADQTLNLTMVHRIGGDGVLPATVAADLEQVHIHVEQKGYQPDLFFDTAANGGIELRRDLISR